MSRTSLRLLSLFALCSLFAAAALGQIALRGQVGGVVTDASGSVVAGARVTLTDLERGQIFTATTDEDGLYNFTNLNFGRYQVAVERDGFKKSVSGDVRLATQQSVRVDLALEVGSVSETVEVKTGGPLLQTEQPNVGSIVDRNFVDNLPVRGGNFSNFAVLASNISVTNVRSAAGVTDSAGARHAGGGINFRAGGGGDNDFSINGVNANDTFVDLFNYVPSKESVAEVKVDVANFSAEGGHNVSNVNAATRAGTNEYHGTAFDFLNNSALNAVNPFTKATVPNFRKPLLQKNQFGGNLGGPVWLPKKVFGPAGFDDRNRLFFFVNYERTIQNNQGNARVVRVPTARERLGDFGELLERFPGDPNFVIYNPYSTTLNASGNSVRTPVPGNDLRRATRPDGSPLIDPRAQQMLNLFPLPNGYRDPTNPNNLNNFIGLERRGYDAYRVDARVDWRVTEGDNVFVTFARSFGRDANTNAIFPDLVSNFEDRNFMLTANYAHVFTPTLTNEFIFGFGRPFTSSADQTVRDYMANNGTPFGRFFGNRDFSQFPGAYQLNISGFPVAGVNPFEAYRPTYQFSDNLSWVRGRHSLKFGGMYLWKKDYGSFVFREVLFDKTFTRAGTADPVTNNRGKGGDSLASFLTGAVTNQTQQLLYEGGDLTGGTIVPYWAFYAEDKFQLNPNFTLSVGLRYDLQIPLYNADRVGNATMDLTYPGWQLAMPGRAPGLDWRYAPADKNNLAPRLSLAYRFKNDFVVRAGYGMFYVTGTGATLGTQLDVLAATNFTSGTQTFDSASFNVNSELPYLGFGDVFLAPPRVTADKFPVSTGPGTGYFTGSFRNVTYRDRESEVLPYFQRYTFEVQKTFGASTVVSASYLGARGTKLPYRQNINLPPYRTGYTTPAANAARPNTVGNRWGNVYVFRNGLNSFYNAGTIRVERRLSRGLQLLAHYTFSKTVEDSAAAGGSGFDYNRRFGRGEASYSHPHRFVSALTYETPWGKTWPGLARVIASGWRVSAITTFESGNALTVANVITSARDLEANRPLLVGDPNLERGERSFLRYFNTAAFADPGQDRKGNAGNGIVRGPGQNNWDLAFGKTFRPVERLSIEFRAEMYNAFNHTQWLNVNTNFTTAGGNTFGRVTAAREARFTQLTLRVLF
jgi:hypothetical protein